MPRINFVVRLQHWIDSVPGQTFLNYAYSWGASIVIMGALFKLTHLPGANLMLFVGMGTEVFVFFISGFDRPFDKEEDGKELPPDYETDEEIAKRLGISLDDDDASATPQAPIAPQTPTVQQPAAVSPTISFTPATPAPTTEGEEMPAATTPAAPASIQPAATAAQPAVAPAVVAGGSPIIIGNIGGGAPAQTATPVVETAASETSETEETPTAQPAPAVPASTIAAAATVAPDIDAQQLAAIIRSANDELLRRTQAVLSPDMEDATKAYIEKLNILNETLSKVDDQNNRLMRDSEEMENLGRTLTGINKIYELQLKGISSQVGTIDDINEQTRHLAEQIQELNGVYSRMIKALTVNMKNAAGAVEE